MQTHRDQISRVKRSPILSRKPAVARVSSTIPHAARRSHRYLYMGCSPLPQPRTPIRDVTFEETVVVVVVVVVLVEVLLADWHRQVRGA